MQVSPNSMPGAHTKPNTQHSPALVHCALEVHIKPAPRQSTQVMSSPASQVPFMLHVPADVQSAGQLVTSSPMPGSHVPLLLQLPLLGQSPHGGVRFISPASHVPLLLQVLPPPQSGVHSPISLVAQTPSPQKGAAASRLAGASGVGSLEPFAQAPKAPTAKHNATNLNPTNALMCAHSTCGALARNNNFTWTSLCCAISSDKRRFVA